MRKPDDPTASTEPSPGESFYGRWSRRKREARAPEVPPAAADRPADALPPATGPAAGEDAERVLTDADMPDLGSLGEDDDYSGFLSPGVSEALRNRALRKLFASGKFNVVDGLNDYDDDFTSFAPLGDIVTSDMRHRVEMEALRAREKAEEEARKMLAEQDADPEAGPADGADRPDEAGAAASDADPQPAPGRSGAMDAAGDEDAGDDAGGTRDDA